VELATGLDGGKGGAQWSGIEQAEKGNTQVNQAHQGFSRCGNRCPTTGFRNNGVVSTANMWPGPTTARAGPRTTLPVRSLLTAVAGHT